MAEAQIAACLEKLVANKKEQDARINQQNAQIKALIEALKTPQGPDVNAVRAEKVSKITFNISKSSKLKPFKISHDIKLFQKIFDEQLIIMKAAVGIADDLSRDEYVPIFRSCLDFPVVERVKVALTGKTKTWEDVEIDNLTALMLEEFGSKQTDVANVLELFGPNRLVKKPDETVSEFFFRWQQNLPENMKPSSNAGYKEYVDLIDRSLFYI